MMPGSKGQKAVRVRMTRLLILESVKYEKFYHVSHAVYGQSVKNSMAWLMWREIIRYIMMRSMKKDSVWQVWILSESVSQFFHILGSVDQQRGCCEVADGKYEITLYTSCCNVTKGIYYYNTYENHQISAVDMHREDLDSEALICYPVIQGEKIHFQNWCSKNERRASGWKRKSFR